MTAQPTPAPLAVDARRLDAFTRSGLYLLALFEPFAALTVFARSTSWPGPGLMVAIGVTVLAHTASCVAVVHLGLAGSLRRTTTTRAVAVVFGTLTAAALALGVVVLPPYAPDGPAGGGIADDPRTLWLAWTAAFTLGALAARVTIRTIVAGVGAAGVLILAVRLPADPYPPATTVALAVMACLAVAFWAGTMRLSVWTLDVVRELDAAREVAGRLAVAEERLRISRDLHDVVGRALSAVAVKSELAAALARRGDPRAADEMDSVRTLARESQREVRGVVAGYRAADLTTELAGARSVLRAAGAAARVVGEVPELTTPQAEALAWVVREAVTNVVRHSEARECVLRLHTDDDHAGSAVLEVTNDGAAARDGGPRDGVPGGGAGLAGLRERLATVGGTLAVDRDGERFTLTARIPRRRNDA